MALHYSKLVENTKLKEARVFGFHVRESIEAYAASGIDPPSFLVNAMSFRGRLYWSDFTHILRKVYGVDAVASNDDLEYLTHCVLIEGMRLDLVVDFLNSKGSEA